MTEPTNDPANDLRDPPPSASTAGHEGASLNAAEALQESGGFGVARGLPAEGDRPSKSNAETGRGEGPGDDKAERPIVTGIPDLLRGG